MISVQKKLWLIIVGLMIGLCRAYMYAEPVGSHSPGFTLIDNEGEEISLSQMEGKPVLLVFVDDSERSQEKLSQLAEIYDYYSVSELKILPIVTGMSPEEAYEFQDELWLTYTLYGDPEGALAKHYDVKQFPEVVLLDNDHIIRYAGTYTTDEELHRELRKWMDEKVFVITGRQFEYEPRLIEVNKGDKVLIKLLAEDVSHGIFIDGYEIFVNQYLDRDGKVVDPEKADHNIKPGEMGIVRFIADKTGRFSLRCAATCSAFHPYMIGHLKVKPNSIYIFGILAVVILTVFFLWLFSKEKYKDRILALFPVNWRFELTRYSIVRTLLKSRWLVFLAIVFNLFVFTVILFACVVGGTSAGNYNFGIMIVWILWWVLLMMLMVPFLSRIWCFSCPLPMVGEWLQRMRLIGVGKKLYGLNKRWPKSLSNMWIVNFLFMATTFTTGFITTRPIATFLLLGAFIIGLSIITCLIYQKRTFCLYLCPVGGFQGLYSNISTLEIRAKGNDVCQSPHLKECIIGSDTGYGCPWMEVPCNMHRNTYCGMCLECFKSCTRDNMALNLRPPGVDLLVDEKRGLDEAWKGFIMIGCAVVFYIIMQGPWGFLKDWANAKTLAGYLKYIFSHTFFTLLVFPAIYGVFVYISQKIQISDEISYKKRFVNYSYILVPVGLLAWIAFSFGILLPNGSYIIAVISDPFAWGWNLFGTGEFPWTPFLTWMMPYLQLGSLLFGLVFSIDIGIKISQRMFPDNRQALKGFIPLAGFLAILTLALLWLFLG